MALFSGGRSRDQLKATTALLRSCFEQAVSKIGVSRGLKERHVAAAAQRGLLSSSEALKARLIDGTLYDDEARPRPRRDPPPPRARRALPALVSPLPGAVSR